MKLASIALAGLMAATVLISSAPASAQIAGVDMSLFSSYSNGGCGYGYYNCPPPPPPPPPPVRVPEPASLALFGAALASLGLARRRR